MGTFNGGTANFAADVTLRKATVTGQRQHLIFS
jgi:hypothetical protein